MFRYKIIQFCGGLGNQMFQYAYFQHKKYSSKLSNYGFDYSIIKDSKEHNGYELYSVFGIRQSYLNVFVLWLSRLPKIRKIFVLRIKNVDSYQEETLESYKKIECPITSNKIILFYFGYWQSLLYLTSAPVEFKKIFKFRTELLNDKSSLCVKDIAAFESVSVHIRRGDYVSESWCEDENGEVCPIEYYNRAIRRLIDLKGDKLIFFIFTNDYEWVNRNLSLNSSFLVDWNIGTDSWQDMYLMSKCKHNIMANSSFSWWGAWLNTN